MMKPRKLPNGKLQARYRDPDGKVRSVGTFSTMKAANEATAIKIAELKERGFDDAARGLTLLRNYAVIYLDARRGSLAPRSLSNYETHLRLHILPKFGHRRLRDIRPSEVAAWWGSMGETPLRKNVYRTLSNLYRLAIEDGEVRTTPCTVKKVGKDHTKPRPYYDQAAVNKLWDACSDDMRALLVVIYGGSLRISEALGLDKRHVNLTTGEVLVEQQLASVDGHAGIRPTTKNGEPRPVLLAGDELAIAKAYRERHKTIGAPFFVNEKGQRLSKSAVYRDWHKAREDAGFPEAHIHDLRHSALTQLMQSGATWAEVMAVAGHKDPRSAMRYQHADPQRLKELVERRSASLG